MRVCGLRRKRCYLLNLYCSLLLCHCHSVLSVLGCFTQSLNRSSARIINRPVNTPPDPPPLLLPRPRDIRLHFLLEQIEGEGAVLEEGVVEIAEIEAGAE